MAFDPTRPLTRYAGNPIFPIGSASSWWAAQYTDPYLLVNPWDPTEVLHYITGMSLPVNSGNLKIGLFSGSVDDPYIWTDEGVVIDTGTPVDVAHTRVGSFVYNEDENEIWAFYTGITDGTGTICLAKSTEAQNGRAFTKFGSNPILTSSGQGRNDGTFISEFSVIKEGSEWTGIYSYRNGGTVMPGYRFATSSDGETWTKGGSGDILTTSPLYAEAHHLFKDGSTYWLLYENGNDGASFHLNLASSSDPGSSFTPYGGNPLLEKTSGVGDFDRYHVATGFLTNLFTDGRWRLFYQGAGDHDQPYGTNHWSGGVAEFPAVESDRLRFTTPFGGIVRSE